MADKRANSDYFVTMPSDRQTASESLVRAADPGGLEALIARAARAGKGLPPVERWNPEFCGDIDMEIRRDGTWFYMGTPIGRPALVQLFSTILRKDPERYVLVTPVERVGITVDDAPFLGVELQKGEDARGQVLRLRTNVDDWVEIDAAHPLRFEKGAADGLKPYVLVRDRLEALVKRALFYDLVAWGEVRSVNGVEMFGAASAGVFFPMARASEVEEWAAT